MGTELLLKTVARVQGRANPNLTLIGFVPTLYASRNSQDTRALSAIREQLNQVGIIFPPIPRSTAFADASEANIPLSMYQPSHPGVKAIKSLAKQLIKKI
jgi:chromosome partitioning protein